MAGKKASISMLIGGDASGLKKAAKNATRSLDKFSKSSVNSVKKVGAAFGKLTAGITVAAVGIGAKAVDLASDFEESMSKTEAVFGDAMRGISDASKTAATDVGLSKAEFLDAASGFGVFGKAAELGGDDLSSFAAELVTTAADVASFNNLTTGEAIEKLSAGLRGSSEPLQSLGILINAAQVEAKALDMGLGDVNGTVSEGNKILARQALIMEALGSQGALGDFAKTSDGLANQQRILQARLKDVGITIGQALLPVAAKLAEGVANLIALAERFAPRLEEVKQRVKELAEQWLPKLREAFDRAREAVEPIIRKIFDFIRTNPKPFIIGIAAAAGVVLVGAIGAAVVALGGIIFSVGGLIVAFGAAVTAIAYFWEESERFRYIVTRVFEDVKTVVNPIIEGIKILVEDLQKAFKGFVDFLKGVFSGDFDAAFEGIKTMFSGFYDSVLTILKTIKEAFKAFFSLDAVQTAIRVSVDKIYDIIKAIPGRVKSLAVGAFDAIKVAFANMINFLLEEWNDLEFTFPGIKGIGSFTIGTPNIPLITIPSSSVPTGPRAPGQLGTAMRERTSTQAAPVVNNFNVVAPNVDPEGLISSLRRVNRNSGGVSIDAIGFNGQAL